MQIPIQNMLSKSSANLRCNFACLHDGRVDFYLSGSMRCQQILNFNIQNTQASLATQNKGVSILLQVPHLCLKKRRQILFKFVFNCVRTIRDWTGFYLTSAGAYEVS